MQRLGATEHLWPALDRYRILKMHHINNRAALITNVDVVAKVDASSFAHTCLDHRSRLVEGVRHRCVWIGELHALLVKSVHVVVKVEEVAGHHPLDEAPRGGLPM